MLVLQRHIDEEIIMHVRGDVIRVKLVGVRGNRAQIGITAGRDVTINRKEVQGQIDREAVSRCDECGCEVLGDGNTCAACQAVIDETVKMFTRGELP